MGLCNLKNLKDSNFAQFFFKTKSPQKIARHFHSLVTRRVNKQSEISCHTNQFSSVLLVLALQSSIPFSQDNDDDNDRRLQSTSSGNNIINLLVRTSTTSSFSYHWVILLIPRDILSSYKYIIYYIIYYIQTLKISHTCRP